MTTDFSVLGGGNGKPTSADTTHVDMDAALARIVQLYENFTLARLDRLSTCYAANAHFRDPFNDVYGIEAIRHIFADMFATLDEPRFIITERVVQGQQAFLEWEFHFRMRRWRVGQQQTIYGGTMLRFDDQGLVLDHRDYWDAAQELYEKLPVLGTLMRWLRRSASATSSATHAAKTSTPRK